MITHIHSATLMVEDQDVALDFYVGKLGWEKRADAPYGDGTRWVEVGPSGAVTTLAQGFLPAPLPRGRCPPGR